MTDSTRRCVVVPAILSIETDSKDPAAIGCEAVMHANALFHQQETRADAPTDSRRRIFLCEASPVTTLKDDETTPTTLHGLTCDYGEQDKLLDALVQMRADVGPLFHAAQAFLAAPHGGAGVAQMAEVNRSRALLTSALQPFLNPEAHAAAWAKDPALVLLAEFEARFCDQVAEDIEIDGSDAVDWITGFAPKVRALLDRRVPPAEAVAADTVAITDSVETEVVRNGVPTISIEHPVTDQLCASILCTALEGGTGYWAVVDDIKRTAGYDTPGADWDYISALFADTEAEEGDEPAFAPTVVDYAVIRTGLQRILAGSCRVRRDLLEACQHGVVENDGGHIDADAADVIVQAGLFGEVTFG